MAATQANFQAAIAFARANHLDPEDMAALLELAIMTPFLDANSGIQMVALTVSADGVNVTMAYEQAMKLLDYFSKKANGGIVVQKAEFTPISRAPGQSS